MKFPINLASQPFRKDRPILFASGLVGGLLLFSLALLISLAVQDRKRSAETRRLINLAEQQIQRTAKDQTRLEAVLRRPENAEVLERSLFLNTLLFRKGISWTKVFADLEKELRRLEDAYYAENDPNYRDSTIEQRFNQTKKQLDDARKDLADARDGQGKIKGKP